MRLCLFLLVAAFSSLAQPSLKIDKGVVFQLTGESFSIDSLIMADSSVLLLDNRHSTNLLRVNYFLVGRGCYIGSTGKNGENGPPGADGSSSLYAAGKPGRGGFSAVNLFFNFSQIEIKDELEIRLTGGMGGNGGLGGSVSQSLSGISTPNRSNSNPSQGPPGDGGDGGKGGNVTLSFPEDLKTLVKEKIKIVSTGGEGGLPGNAAGSVSPGVLRTSTLAGAGKRGASGKIEYVYLKR